MLIRSTSTFLVFIMICSLVAAQENAADDWIKKGWALIDVESYPEAMEYFDRAISLDSSSPEAWHGKGFALNGEAYEKDDAHEFTEARGYFEEAIKCFEKAIELNSSYLDAYMDMADSENKLDNYEKALELIEKAIKINPNNAEVFNVKGTILYRMGKYDESIELFRKAKTLDPKCANAWSNICVFLKEQKKGDSNAAIEAADACQKAADFYNANVRN
jgi:tetratricopeptide (TPR) repeat protein